MKKFCIQTFVFISPLFLILTIISFILEYSGEYFTKIEELVRKNEKYLIGYGYNQNNYKYLKWFYLNSHERKSVIALGSSRVLQFRASMFDTSFYNAGYTISSVNDFLPFLQGIPKSKYPEYLIIGLDQWMFNKNYDNLTVLRTKESWKNSFVKYPTKNTYWDVFKNIFKGKYNKLFLQNSSSDYIGLSAKINNKGFRNDGSIYYGDQIIKLIKNDTTANDYKYRDTYNRIKNGNRRFEYGIFVNDSALIVLDKFLNYCSENHIKLIAFLPPFADKVFNSMIKTENYNYLNEIYPKIKPLFDKYAYEIYNFSTVSSCNSSDKETIDGFHGGEITYQKILINMLNSGSILNNVSNPMRLKNDLIKSKNKYIVYDY